MRRTVLDDSVTPSTRRTRSRSCTASELGLLDMKPHDVALGVLGRSIVRATPPKSLTIRSVLEAPEQPTNRSEARSEIPA